LAPRRAAAARRAHQTRTRPARRAWDRTPCWDETMDTLEPAPRLCLAAIDVSSRTACQHALLAALCSRPDAGG
jgi:hypothetical protein